MASARHRGTHTSSGRPRRPGRPGRAAVAVATLAVGGLAAGTFTVRALAGGGQDPSATTFTGVVTEFADDGAMVCVRRPGASDAPFCDVYFLPPHTPDLEVGDRVVVTTIASRAEDGSPVSGMLVSPIP
jgi:hypothetical protein